MSESLARSMPGTAFARLESWMFAPLPAYPIVICRIGLGMVLFFAYGSRWSLVDTLYGPAGFGGAEFHERFPEAVAIGYESVRSFNHLQYVESAGLIWFLYLVLLASALSFAMGIKPKLTGTLSFALHVLFVARNPASAWGWSLMIKPFLIYTVLGSRAQHASVLRWWKTKRGIACEPTDWTCSGWPIRLYQIHMMCVFLVVWDRLDEQSWLTGQMLAAALVSRDWARFDIDWSPYFGLLEIPGKIALVLEVGAPFMLWIKPIAKYWALALFGMFFTLSITTIIGWWDFTMMFSFVMFMPPEWLRRVFGQNPIPANA